jgi:hypothetical protein
MDGKDLEYAKEIFNKKKVAFVIVKDGEVLAESREQGVGPFFSAAAARTGGSAADKIVGKAVAFLCAYAKIVSVYTPVASEPAVAVLRDHSIYLEAEMVVPMILNRQRDGQCPMEQLIIDCTTPQEAFTLLKKRVG